MHIRRLAALIGLGLLLGGSAHAQTTSEVTIEAEATPSEVGTAENVAFKIRVKGAPVSAIDTPDPPSTTNLVLQDPTPTTRRELSFDSGRLTRHVTLEWTYEPMQVGLAHIRPATIRVRGERYTTDEIRVRIVPQSQRSSNPARPHADPAAPSRQSGSSRRSALGPRDLFIRATSSSDDSYQNEQVTVEYRLFFRPGVRLRQSRMAEAWDAPGFWREELDVASRPTPRPTTMYGHTYKAIVLKRVALFPTRPGTLRVDPLYIETEAQARSVQNPRGGRAPRPPYEPITLSSEAVSVVATPLPAGAPLAFDGAVGQFTLHTQVDVDSVEVGDAVTLTARLQGTGNLATVSPPTLEAPPGIETFDPSVRTEIDRSGDTVRGSKTFTYTLVPHSNSQFTLPPVTFSYFDPGTEQYETLRSEPMTLQATGDVPPQVVAQTGRGLPVGEIASPISDDVRWVHPDRAPLYRQPWVYVAVLVPIVLVVGGVTYRRYAQEASPLEEAPKALDAAQRHLRDAHHHLRDGEVEPFYETVERAVLTFLTTRLALSRTPSGLTRNTLDHHLTRCDVPDADQKALHELLDACDQAQFTPTDPSHDAMQATLDHAQTLLLRFDDTLPDRPVSETA